MDDQVEHHSNRALGAFIYGLIMMMNAVICIQYGQLYSYIIAVIDMLVGALCLTIMYENT